MKVYLIGFLVFGSWIFAGPKGPDDASLKQKVDQFLSAGVAQGFSGNVMVVREGRIVMQKGYGLANRDTNQAWTPDTVTTIGSVTKQFTGAAILKLVEQGKLKTSDTLATWFKDAPADKSKITIHQLLIHASGLSNIGTNDFDHIPTDTYFKRLFAAPLEFEPGTRHRYSNSGYSVLGRIIELASNQSYEAYLNENLFKPAGMKHTGYLIPRWDTAKVAHGYAHGVHPMGSLIDRFQTDKKISWILQANGGVHSTLGDMYRWMQALKDHRILSPESFKTLTTPWIAEDESGSSHYGYGWALFKSSRGTKIISHNGGNGIYFFDFIWLPEEDALVLFATNAVSRQVEVSWNIARMMFDAEYDPKPIGPNPFAYAAEFITKHDHSKASELFTNLAKKFPRDYDHPRFLNRLGYDLLRVGDHSDWALAVFLENSRRYPKVPNVWDSLSDGYLAKNNKPKAIQALEKAAEMGMPQSKERLKELKAE